MTKKLWNETFQFAQDFMFLTINITIAIGIVVLSLQLAVILYQGHVELCFPKTTSWLPEGLVDCCVIFAILQDSYCLCSWLVNMSCDLGLEWNYSWRDKGFGYFV